MAGTNWQYAALTKGERLDKIRGGDTQVYAQEKARINTLINSYKELGLDTSEQEVWARSLDLAATNNNGKGGSVSAEEKLYNSARLSAGEISSYTSIYPSDKAQEERARSAGQSYAASSPVSYGVQAYDYASEKSAALSKAQGLLDSAYSARQSALDSYYAGLNAQAEGEYSGRKQEAYAYAMNRLPAIREGLANAGLHAEGGTSRSEQLKYQAGLDGALSALDAQKASLLSGNNRARESESAGLYSDYVKALSDERARLDELYYKIGRDAQDDAYRNTQLARQDAQLAQQQVQYERNAQSADAKTAAQYSQWEKEFALKSDAQSYSQERTAALDREERERFEKEYELKLKQADEALSQWEREFGFRQSQAALSQSNADRDYEFKAAQAQSAQSGAEREYEYKNAQLEQQREQALREYALRLMAQDQSAAKSQRDYAMQLLENSQSYEKWLAEYELKRQAQTAAQEKAAAGQSASGQSSSGQSAPAKADTQPDNKDARSDTYNAFLDAAMWMKTVVTGTSGSSQRQFTDQQISDWVASLPISSRQRRDIMEAVGG